LRYCCKFPGCKFSTNVRGRIDNHHIIPRGWPGSSNKPNNLIMLCPGHHRAIHVPGETHGHHSTINEDSIAILDVLESNKGKVLRYRKCSDMIIRYYHYHNGEIEVDWKSTQLNFWSDPGNYFEI